ncbi:MAG: Fe-S protein assembly co-chaperone HscB, partial [Hymenobacteraceae bacterium]|nr:Fe-S protein assembly co-chaperone HscB [Hymenobacteraceae bacterium]MDX5512717.1 Fe-S protein assembly co-chaperone HscB [Hymenobacteraceae bacterium]
MNYFTYYNIPVSFYPDEKLLRSKYYELSRKYHPDFYVNEPEEKQQEVLEQATFNTNAYRTLSDFDKRMQYMLQSHHLLEEKSTNELPGSFLMEMMELNEQLMELEFDFDPEVYQRVKQEFEEVLERLETQTEPLLRQYEQLNEAEKQEALKKIKTYYLKKKY